MYDARQIARSMIERASAKGLELSNLTLQKLLYIAHGAALGHLGRPLLRGNFSAWRYGPVVENLYHDLKVFGAGAIKADDRYIAHWDRIPAEDADAIGVVDSVLDHFGRWSGASLIQWSHREDGPWFPVYNNKSLGSDIPNEAIKQYFQERVLQAS